MAKTVVAYPGGKWRFWPFIRDYIPRDIRDYREPFFGGGSIGLSILDDPEFNLERVVVGDLNTEMWSFWQGTKECPHEVADAVVNIMNERCPIKIAIDNGAERTPEIDEKYEKEARDIWSWVKSVDCSTLDLPNRAARMFISNGISFSATGDSGSLSLLNYGKFTTDRVERIIETSGLLKNVEIKNCSFEETMADVDPEKTFIFLDPPYFKQEGAGLYGRNGDLHKGFPHSKFAEVTLNTNCRWFITYDDSVKIRKMFRGRAVYSGERCNIVPFVIPGGYTMAINNSEDTLKGEELFIMNYDVNGCSNEELFKLL